jgi:hypothetical protein
MEKRELWTPEKRLALLPDFPRELFVEEAKFLYEDFLDHPLKIGTRQADYQKHINHKVREVKMYNPGWYSDFYWSHSHAKRQLVEKSLHRIVNGLDMDLDTRSSKHRYAYDTSLRWRIYLRLTEGYQVKEGDKPYRVFPDNAVRAFFNLEKMEIPDEKVEDSLLLDLEEPPIEDKEYNDIVPF